MTDQTVAAPIVFFSHNIGVQVLKNTQIMENPTVKAMLESIPPEHKEENEESIVMSIDTHELGHFLHMVYCFTPEGTTVVANFDGIFSYETPDADEVMQKFNAQLVTLSVQPE